MQPREARPYSVDAGWSDWRWQQSNSVRDVSGLRAAFPGLSAEVCERIARNNRRVRFQLTPYMLSLIRCEADGAPEANNPIWMQYVPAYAPPPVDDDLANLLGDNWELPEDMITPILQHKYENRVNFRIQNRCLAYCSYCFEAKRVLDKDSKIKSYRDDLFLSSLNYIQSRPDIHEVVISGGEALTLSNQRLDRVLTAIRAIEHVQAIRIQTRALSHNPFRVDHELVRILHKHSVTAMGVHVSHPVEITPEFISALGRLADGGCRMLLLGQVPLLRHINDDEHVLEELFMTLYSLNIKPYYLLHSMPDTLGADRFRTTVKRGVELVSKLKRRISNPAMPEYVVVHAKGKHTVPLEVGGTPEFQYTDTGFVRFKNWRGEWCDYLDGSDS